MPEPAPSQRTTVKRKPQRASYARADIEAIIDAAFICSVAFSEGGSPHCLPINCWRVGDHLYIHTAPRSRLANALLAGECCVCIAHIDGLVLARSAFHHSMNYRSAVIYGRFEEVLDTPTQESAYRAFIEHVSPGRSTQVRATSAAERSATCLLRIPLHEAVSKSRVGGVADAPADRALPVWAGVVPLALRAGVPTPDSGCEGAAAPALPARLEAPPLSAD